MMDVSIVIPIHNERLNIQPLFAELERAMRRAGVEYELLFVDDGSTDGSDVALMKLVERYAHVRLISFRRNYGQTAAMQAGIERAHGDVIVTIDGDLQNDPSDIPMMLNKLSEGYDLVHGWRRHRKDPWLTRRLPSIVANWLIARSTRFPVNDLGCTLKVIRADIARELKLYGEMHRFIPILAAQRGAKCVEVETNHRPRQFGDSKYGLSRTIRVVLDLVTVKYLQTYFANPMKLFGLLGLGAFAMGSIAIVSTIAMKLVGHVDMTGNPFLLLAVFCLLAGIQLFGLGLLGEVLARIYYESNTNRPYAIELDSSSPTHSRELQNAA